jgi:hypothetical protein
VSQQLINIGSAPNDGTGDQLRASFDKCNLNFTELYGDMIASLPLGNAIEYQFNNATTVPPANGEIRFNQATQSSTTILWASHTTSAGINIKQMLSAAIAGSRLILQDKNDNTNYIKFNITADPIDRGTYWEFAVAVTASGGTLPNARILAAVTAAASTGGGGNVSNSGTPTNGQLASWTDATHIQGITTLPAANEPAHTGDVTNAAGSLALTIANNIVTNAKLANVTAPMFKGRTTAGTSSPEDLTPAQATALLNLFTSALKGLVPASGGGTTNFLRADATWAAPPGGGAPGLVLLNTLTASNSAVLTDTTSITSTYDSYEIEFVNVVPITTAVTFFMQVQIGGSFITTGYNPLIVGATGAGSAAGTNTFAADVSSTGFLLSGTGTNLGALNNTAGYGVSGIVRLHSPAGSQRKYITGQSSWTTPSGAINIGTLGGYLANTSPITGIQFLFGTGNISTGLVRIYGRKTS